VAGYARDGWHDARAEGSGENLQVLVGRDGLVEGAVDLDGAQLDVALVIARAGHDVNQVRRPQPSEAGLLGHVAVHLASRCHGRAGRNLLADGQVLTP